MHKKSQEDYYYSDDEDYYSEDEIDEQYEYEKNVKNPLEVKYDLLLDFLHEKDFNILNNYFTLEKFIGL